MNFGVADGPIYLFDANVDLGARSRRARLVRRSFWIRQLDAEHHDGERGHGRSAFDDVVLEQPNDERAQHERRSDDGGLHDRRKWRVGRRRRLGG
jgi:hypothetical protein